MKWETPSYTDLRFGFEVTMYIYNRWSGVDFGKRGSHAVGVAPFFFVGLGETKPIVHNQLAYLNSSTLWKYEF